MIIIRNCVIVSSHNVYNYIVNVLQICNIVKIVTVMIVIIIYKMKS